MSIDVSLLTLLETGKFGPVTIGSSVTEVREHFGDPDLHHQSNIPNLELWRFGDVELHFEDGRVFLFWNDDVPFPARPSNGMALDAWLFSNGSLPDREQIEASLTLHGIAHTWVDIPSDTDEDDYDHAQDGIFSRDLGSILIRGEHHLSEINLSEVIEVLGDPGTAVGKTIAQFVSVGERKFMEERLRRRRALCANRSSPR